MSPEESPTSLLPVGVALWVYWIDSSSIPYRVMLL